MAFAWDEFGPVGSLGGPQQLACRVDPKQRKILRSSQSTQKAQEQGGTVEEEDSIIFRRTKESCSFISSVAANVQKTMTNLRDCSLEDERATVQTLDILPSLRVLMSLM